MMTSPDPVDGATTAPIELPALPAAVKDFIPYFTSQHDTAVPKILKPFVEFESELRKVYAQQPHHEAVKDGLTNTVPIFMDHESELKIRARCLSTEPEAGKEEYIMPLADDQRKPNGSPAVVTSFKEFQKNFNLFSETSLSELDWNNVVAAGSSVTTALLPVPVKWAGSKKSLREYYHDHLAPASDVDLFLYGLTENEAIEKIKQIERTVRDSVLQEVTTIRTKNTITIASQYPTRHVQIVLRLYDSISQIITGFDVDCACVAYDGKQVYASPRALASFVTQINTVDLTRRSPSYENRLSKYSHRGFEVHWPLLDRSRIDPTIFERSFHRTQGLARLLVLEKLPKTTDRDDYMDQRRAERGRPPVNRYARNLHKYWGNIKDEQEDDVAEWVEASEISNYHTLVIPYGKRFTAAKINRILYSKDLLLNAEWNIPRDRTVHLHRHPCFFGTAEDVLGDCCGHCPVASTDEEIEVAKQETKTYISGNLSFIKEDPGRQEIGSFNPITSDDWTEMAYVGNTQMLCQAIVDGDNDFVERWCMQDGNDVNTRDYVGRTPLHLAVTCSSLEIIQCLVDNDSRLVARLVDGRTALHLAAQLGRAEVVKCLMKRSLANEEEESVKERSRKMGRKSEGDKTDLLTNKDSEMRNDDESEISDENTEDWNDSDEDSVTMGSVIKIRVKPRPQDSSDIPDDNADEPDVYDIEAVAWDFQTAPLHLAILNGHVDTIKLLVEEYGADVLAPIKIFQGNNIPSGALLTLYLALSLPEERSKQVIRVLLELGASTAQADMNHSTALHYIVQEKREDIVDIIFELDRPAAQRALNYVAVLGAGWGGKSARTALLLAIQNGHQSMATKLLSFGANSTVAFDDFIKSFISKHNYAKDWNHERSMDAYQEHCDQPILRAATREMGITMKELLADGADPNTLDSNSYRVIKNPTSTWQSRASVLDVIRQKLKALKEYLVENSIDRLEKPETLKSAESYVTGLVKGSYQHWTALNRFGEVKKNNERAWEEYYKALQNVEDIQMNMKEKKLACEKLIKELGRVETELVSAGAKTFAEMYPSIPIQEARFSSFGMRFVKPETPIYETYFTFQVPNLNDIMKEGYFRLFEAVWANDIDNVKALTLNSWKGSDGTENTPLKIAVADTALAYPKAPQRAEALFLGFSPFSLAVLRKHLELAKIIVQIAQAQYQPEDDKKRRGRLAGVYQGYSVSDESDFENSEDDDDAPRIYTRTVDDTFTVNVTDISCIVKSHITPLAMMEWECNGGWFLSNEEVRSPATSLIAYAVRADDTSLLKFLLKLFREQTAFANTDKDDASTAAYKVSRSVFVDAIRLGRTAALAELIKTAGAGLPLDDLVKSSGLIIQEKPKYYQGLTVAGKKRKDWAQAGNPRNNIFGGAVTEKQPPLLEAAREHSIESIQWFLSDAPARRYAEFAAANKSDKRVEVLEHSDTGFEKTVINWLSARNELSLHCSILREPEKEKIPEQLAVVKYLLSVMPDSLDHRSSQGWSPLQCAVNVSRPDIVQILVEAGANKRSRDTCGRNAVHNMMVRASYSTGSWDGCMPRTDPDNFRAIISHFPKNEVKEMLLEKCTLDSTDAAMTPLAYWMARVPNFSNMPSSVFRKPDMLQVLSSYSNGGHLGMVNGAGDLPLHVAVRKSLCAITSYLISLNPSLLNRENTVGLTPLELSSDLYLQERVSKAPSFDQQSRIDNADLWTGADKEPSFFRVNTPAEQEEALLMESSKKRTYEICFEAAQYAKPAKRRLVSLWEANEVAKRLAGATRRIESREVEEEVDEVTQWMVAI